MATPKLTESMIRAGATPESFKRGYEYFASGAVSNTSVIDTSLFGVCEGISAPYYQVRVELDKAGIRDAECSCPYDWGGWCKHIVALLLAYLDDPKQFVVRAAPAELLAGLSRDDLVPLLDELMHAQPDLYDRVAAAVAEPPKTKTGKARRRKAVDTDVYRRRVIGILHSLDGMRRSEAYWHTGSLVKQLDEVQESATKFLEAGESQTALEILLVLLEETSLGIELVDDSDGYLGGFLAQLDAPISEAILSLDAGLAERKKLVARLKKLEARLRDYGMEDMLYLAIDAAEHGWQLPPAADAGQRTAGRRSTLDEWDDDDEFDGEFDDEDAWSPPLPANLTDIKLNILERRGDTEEYLKLCLETGRHLRYAIKLTELGRVAQAVKHGKQKLRTADEAHDLAERLRAGGHVAEALMVGERGLKLQAPRYRLAAWLGPVEEAQGRSAAALAAWQVAFSEEPSLVIYQSLKRLAGTKWKKLRPDLMAGLRRSGSKMALVEVLLDEQEWDEAIKVADGRQVWYDVVEKVADEVLPHRPEWVAHASRKRAERLMVEPKSKNYPLAAAWLRRAKQAHLALGQTAEWRDYLEKIKDQYRRRPALQAQLHKL